MNVKIGLEKECLVFDMDMNPVDIDIDNLCDNLTVDFANHQLEIVTDPLQNALLANEQLSKFANDDYFQDKLMWPLSIPPKQNAYVKYNRIDSNYRQYLAHKYGIDKMLYSGIHFNYSNDRLITEEDYFLLIQNVFDYMPILLQFTSFTPFANKQGGGTEMVGTNYGFEDSISLRASDKYGYSNGSIEKLNFSSYENYVQTRNKLLNDDNILDERELYSKVRLKKANKSNYIELRFIDLNPYFKSGVSDETLVLIESTLNYLSKLKTSSYEQNITDRQIENTTLHGLDKSLKMIIGGKENSLHQHTVDLIDTLIAHEQSNIYKDYLRSLKAKYINNNLDINIMHKTIIDNDLAIDEFSKNNIFKYDQFIMPYPEKNMELSTKLLMKEAIDQGFNVNIESELQNIIKITNGQSSEYVIQATKTNLDTYANVLLMNDKFMTKKILAERSIDVPYGIKLKDGERSVVKFSGLVVVKPHDTNFGLGISIVDSQDEVLLDKAIANAFEYSDEIIIEQYAKGQEYRLLVIDDQVVSVVTRKNANVIGDGQSTLEQLIKQKNSSPMRQTGYKTPLELINIDSDLIRVITKQGYTLEDVIDNKTQVLLRDTSNVSQGGDSYEVYDIISMKYKQISVEAAKALGVKICGIDMIIDFESGQYKIIEANFNPAIHMHMYPYSGRGRNVAASVMKALFKKLN